MCLSVDGVWAPVTIVLAPFMGLAAPAGFSGQEVAFHDVSQQDLVTYVPFVPQPWQVSEQTLLNKETLFVF